MYIHIPFCNTICTYCDFCKLIYNKKWVMDYLKCLEKEISVRYKGELLNTIYIGGGTPNSLSDTEFEYLLKIVSKINKTKDIEYTIECNIELLTENQIILMKKYGVNRVSLGIQTFNPKYLKFLNRHHTKEEVIEKINLLKRYGINNINVDLIYAISGSALEDLESDLEILLKLDVPHISTYSLMIEPNTILYIRNEMPIDEDLDYLMYKKIEEKLNNYNHYEVSNFALPGFESKHNLKYWNNLEYYGIGLSASGYIDNVRYTNTFNLSNYLKGEVESESHLLSKKEQMENEMILGLRKLEGVNIKKFYDKYNVNIEDVFDINALINNNDLVKENGYLKIKEDKIYISNDILVNFIGDDYE